MSESPSQDRTWTDEDVEAIVSAAINNDPHPEHIYERFGAHLPEDFTRAIGARMMERRHEVEPDRSEAEQDQFILLLRRELMQVHHQNAKAADKTFEALDQVKDDEEYPPYLREANVGLFTSATYAYILAAALKLVYDRCGREAAFDLAYDLRDQLDNGDFDNVNADLT